MLISSKRRIRLLFMHTPVSQPEKGKGALEKEAFLFLLD